MRCPTASGPFRCDREIDATGTHPGECVTRSTSTAMLGPASDGARASLHLRALLDERSGERLDGVGSVLKVARQAGEPDVEYRERIWAAR